MAGHIGIKGNKEVDTKAKKVAAGMTSSIENLLLLLRKKIKPNKSALKQQRRSRLKAQWSQEWKTSPRYNKTSAIDPSFSSSNFLKLISNDCLSRVDISCICQLQTGHISLNVYLARIGKVSDAKCLACGHLKEDMRHLLIDCPAYAHKR